MNKIYKKKKKKNKNKIYKKINYSRSYVSNQAPNPPSGEIGGGQGGG
jgi:hypothetical protein|tara:strand:+ start:2245 stop:2385 length:141 start_codon:yes stop_codon:yes gene_type:complete